MSSQTAPRIPLPKGWNEHVRLSLLHVISPTQFADACTHGWNADSTTLRLRRKTELLCLTATIVLDSNRSESDRKRWLKNRPSTATNRAIGSDKTCKFRPSD